MAEIRASARRRQAPIRRRRHTVTRTRDGLDWRWPAGGRVVCESNDYRYTYCPVPVRRDVDLVAQYSKSPCRFQSTWGYDRGGVWVDRGCAAEFVVY